MLANLWRQRKNITLSSIGATFNSGPHWQHELLNGSTAWWSRGTGGVHESIEANFEELVDKAYKANGIVFACIQARALPFSEVRFQFQELVDDRPGRLSGGPQLGLLAAPWPNATTGEMLWRLEQDASLAGNCYLTPVGEGPARRLRRLRPDWVKVVSGVRGEPSLSPYELDAEILGYIYHPTGVRPAVAPTFISVERMIHYSPIPDPMAQWRGMSWLQPVVDEIIADSHATRHKLKFFQNGATSNMVIVYDKSIKPEDLPRYQAVFDQAHAGVDNAYKTLHIGGGADAKVLGADLKQLDFKATQGAGETRIAAAAGVGAIMARFSEGLQGSSLNAGNYGAAKRQFADMTLRPLWRTAAASFAKPEIVQVPASHRLWYDDRDVEFLKEDRKDSSEILQQQATTIRQLVDAGYSPDAVIDAVEAHDLSRLTGKHSGLFSVQLQPAGSAPAPKAAPRGQEQLPFDQAD